MKLAATLCFLVAAAINLAPVAGVASAGRLAALYGVPFADPTLEILMRHRAVLFGIVGALLGAAAFRPSLQAPAAAAGFTSMLSFVAIAWGVGDVSPALRRIAWADVIGSAALGLGLLLRWYAASKPAKPARSEAQPSEVVQWPPRERRLDTRELED